MIGDRDVVDEAGLGGESKVVNRMGSGGSRDASRQLQLNQLIWRVFTKTHGLTLQADAAQYLSTRVAGGALDGDPSAMAKAFAVVANAYKKNPLCINSVMVTLPLLTAVLDQLFSEVGSVGRGDGSSSDLKSNDSYNASSFESSNWKIRLVNSVDCPLWTFDPHQKVFVHHLKAVLPADQIQKSFQLSPAPLKAAIYQRQYEILKQRIYRTGLPSALFLSTATDPTNSIRPAASNLPSASSLSTIKIAKGAGENVTCLVLGMVSQIREDQVYLEDPEDQIKLVIPTQAPPFLMHQLQRLAPFLTESTFVLVAGSVKNGSFFLSSISLPLTESRLSSRSTLSLYPEYDPVSLRLGPTNYLSQDQIASSSTSNDTSSILFLSNVDLSADELVLARLDRLFSTFDSVPSESIPSLIVLQGPFSPSGSLINQSFSVNTESLALVLSKYSRIISHCKFILIPARGDFDAPDIFPIPAPSQNATLSILKALLRIGADCTIASNPCRIFFHTKELFIFRDEVSSRLAEHSLYPCLVKSVYPAVIVHAKNSACTPLTKEIKKVHGNSESKADLSTDQTDFVKRSMDMAPSLTLGDFLLSQANVLPLPLSVQSRYWHLDHAMSIYPPPHLLIVSEEKSPAMHSIISSCHLVNTGSFSSSKGGSFALIFPLLNRVDLW